MGLRNWNMRQKPTGLWKHVLHLPVHLFHLRLGFLFGQRFILITHVGRRSGIEHQTVVEVVEHDVAAGEYIVCSGTGPHADWYRNLHARPAPLVQVGNRSWVPVQRLLTQGEAAARFHRYEVHHPKTAEKLLETMGRSYDGTDEGRFEMVAEMPMVAFGEPDTSDHGWPSGPADAGS